VGEIHAQIQYESKLWVASHPLFDARHSNQHEPNAAGIEDCPHLLKADNFETIGFIHQNQPGWITDTLLLCNVLSANCGVRRLELWRRSG
jgi:hypothetical protein